MPRDQHVESLLADLIRAIELSLAASEAARALVAQLLKANVGDQEFLSALSIRFEDR